MLSYQVTLCQPLIAQTYDMFPSLYKLILIILKTIFIALSFTVPAICKSSLWFLWTRVGQRQVAVNS